MIQDIAPHRLGNQYDPAALPEAEDYVLFFDGGKVLLTENSLPKVKDFPADSPFTYLFTLDSSRFFRAIFSAMAVWSMTRITRHSISSAERISIVRIFMAIFSE